MVTVVTDPYTAHPIWFLEKRNNFIVFSEELKANLVSNEGIKTERITVFPFIINPKFCKPTPIQKQLAVRGSLGIDPESKVVLILGGADGIPQGKKLLSNMLKTQPNCDVVMVCGRNKGLFNAASRMKEKYYLPRLHVLGFVDNVPELLSISEVVITKCGASTFMEILLKGKIPLVSSYIWEQEKGNVDFIRHNRLGIFEPNPSRIIKLAGEIVKNECVINIFQKNIAKLNLSNGTPLVSNFLLNFKETSHEPACNF